MLIDGKKRNTLAEYLGLVIILHVFQWTEVALIAYIGPTFSKFCPEGTLEQQPTTGIGGFDTKKKAQLVNSLVWETWRRRHTEQLVFSWGKRIQAQKENKFIFCNWCFLAKKKICGPPMSVASPQLHATDVYYVPHM